MSIIEHLILESGVCSWFYTMFWSIYGWDVFE